MTLKVILKRGKRGVGVGFPQPDTREAQKAGRCNSKATSPL
jgi:hypothetical protein